MSDEVKELKRLSRTRCFEGWLETWSHYSKFCKAPMKFSIYLPPQAHSGNVPALYWLSGLTCTEENFMQKSGAQRFAAQLGLALIAPDTSPRNTGIEHEDKDWDFGSGAGFYVNATASPWSAHYKMYDYIKDELPKLINAHFPVNPERKSISGHSMGGHGALVVGLRNSDQYQSISAFSPICASSQTPWGQKALQGYLGNESEAWYDYDACRLVTKGKDSLRKLPLLVEQGGADEFMQGQLQPERLKQACQQANYPLQLNIRPDYDHSYFFVGSFIENHLRHHASALGIA